MKLQKNDNQRVQVINFKLDMIIIFEIENKKTKKYLKTMICKITPSSATLFTSYNCLYMILGRWCPFMMFFIQSFS